MIWDPVVLRGRSETCNERFIKGTSGRNRKCALTGVSAAWQQHMSRSLVQIRISVVTRRNGPRQLRIIAIGAHTILLPYHKLTGRDEENVVENCK